MTGHVIAVMWWPLGKFTALTCRLAWKVAGVTRLQLAAASWSMMALVGWASVDSMWHAGWWVVELLIWFSILMARGFMRPARAGGPDEDGFTLLWRPLSGFWWSFASIQMLTQIGLAVIGKGSFVAEVLPAWSAWLMIGYLVSDDDEDGEPILHRAIRGVADSLRSLRPATVSG